MKKYLFAILCLWCGTMLSLHAQDKKNMFNPVTTSVTSQSIAPDARGGAMGDLGAATEPDVSSQYWNPAKYPFCIGRAGVAVNYTPWLRQLVNDINLAYVSGFYRLGDYQALSASLRYFSLGEVSTSSDMSSSDNMTISPYEMSVDVAYSRMLSETFSAAVALRFIYSDITYDYSDETSPGKAFAADIALYWNRYFTGRTREWNMGIGLNISNIGSKISYGGDDNSEFIPTNLRLGVNFLIPINEYNKFSIAADANKLLVPTYPKQNEGEADQDYTDRVQRDYYDISPIAGIFKSFGDAPNGFKEEMQEIQWSMGLEYIYNDRFSLRAGYHHESENQGKPQVLHRGCRFPDECIFVGCRLRILYGSKQSARPDHAFHFRF